MFNNDSLCDFVMFAKIHSSSSSSDGVAGDWNPSSESSSSAALGGALGNGDAWDSNLIFGGGLGSGFLTTLDTDYSQRANA